MKASDLNGTHLGRHVTVTEGFNSVNGKLARIEHLSEVVTDQPFMGLPTETINRTFVHLEFLGHFTANVTPNAEATIND
jgi:hypothetical protein